MAETMEFKLYNAPQSTCSQRVRYMLHAKGKAFEEHKMDLFRGDQLTPDYLKINPNGVVPALVHHGEPIIDSAVILEYLEDICPDVAPLRPADPLEVARMRAIMRFIDEVPTPAIRIPSYNLAFLPHFQAMSEDDFLELAESKPLRREFLLRMGRTGFPRKDMDEALDRLGRGIGRLAQLLEDGGGPWIMGPSITLADIAMMPVLVRMEDIGLGYVWEPYPAVSRLLERLQSSREFAATYYKGSLLTEKYPHLANRRASHPPRAAQ
jgi:glutathione S-transferase